MSFGRENDIVYAITGPVPKKTKVRPVEPLVRYLRERRQIGDHLRDALADLLDENGNSVWQLKLVRRDTRFVKSADAVDSDIASFSLVAELTGAKVTGSLLERILRNLPEWKAKRQGSNLVLKNRLGVTQVRIPTGKPLSKNLAIRLKVRVRMARMIAGRIGCQIINARPRGNTGRHGNRRDRNNKCARQLAPKVSCFHASLPFR